MKRNSMTQADALERLVEERRGVKYHTVILAPVCISRKSLQSLSVGDILLLGYHIPELYLEREGNYFKLAFDQTYRAIVGEKVSQSVCKGKRQDLILVPSFGSFVEEKTLTLDFLDPKDLLLYVNKQAVAQGKLVWVKQKVGIEITKVK